jgi:peroxiredoxin
MSSSAAQSAAARLIPGDPARPFKVTDIFGSERALTDYEGKKLMLSFYRYASCPLCNLRIARLIQRYPEFHKRGLHMLTFFQSPRDSILQYVGRQDAPFPIVADPERKIYRIYRVESSWGGYARSLTNISRWHDAIIRNKFRPGRMEGDKALIPADFLIGPDLVIKRAYYGKEIGDHMPLDEIEAFIA